MDKKKRRCGLLLIETAIRYQILRSDARIDDGVFRTERLLLRNQHLSCFIEAWRTQSIEVNSTRKMQRFKPHTILPCFPVLHHAVILPPFSQNAPSSFYQTHVPGIGMRVCLHPIIIDSAGKTSSVEANTIGAGLLPFIHQILDLPSKQVIDG